MLSMLSHSSAIDFMRLFMLYLGLDVTIKQHKSTTRHSILVKEQIFVDFFKYNCVFCTQYVPQTEMSPRFYK